MRVLITGAGIRLGEAMSRAFAHAGFDVAIHYRTAHSPAEALAETIRAKGREAILVPGDLSQPSGPARIAAAVMDAWDSVDVLVNNAAAYAPCPIEDLDCQTWDEMLAVNTRAPLLLSRALLPALRKRTLAGGGSILNLVDITAERPVPGYAHYTASKAALVALTRALALELAPQVRVNAIAPGTVLAPPDLDAESLDRIVATIPLRRTGTPADVANAAVFLCSAPYITGQVLAVDGGRSVGGPMEAG